MREFWSEVLPDEVLAVIPAKLKRDAPTTIAMPPPIACFSLRFSHVAGYKIIYMIITLEPEDDD
jgi:hypothetical protein